MWKKLRKKLDLPESYISITLGFLVVLVVGILTYNFFVRRQVEQKKEEAKVEEGKKEEAVAELPTTYKVQAGDDLWKIAEKHYKSGYNWVTIAQTNNLVNPDRILVGQELKLPKAEVIRPPGEVSAITAATPKEYTVVKGDTLWNIAEKQLGSGYAWTNIAKFNNLANPDVIHPGNVFKLSQ